MIALATVLLVVLAVRTELIGAQRIGSDSMEQTLRRGDVVLVVRHGAGPPHRGDLVTFRSPQDGVASLKRVVGTAGDRVAIEDAVLSVNGRDVDEPYVDHRAIDALYYGPVKVPAGSLLVLGDARAISIDSRHYGPVPERLVTGRVVLRLWPLLG